MVMWVKRREERKVKWEDGLDFSLSSLRMALGVDGYVSVG